MGPLIAVVGGSSPTVDEASLAEGVGRALAEAGAVLVCGGLPSGRRRSAGAREAAENGNRKGKAARMRAAILSAQAEVDVPVGAARDWFLSLEEHPERYTFDTHEGFEFEMGGFGEVGARFRTRERFFFLRLELLFELTEVHETAFWFWLCRPSWIGVWGRFEIEEDNDGQSVLLLSIGSETRLGQFLLRFYPVAASVQAQIRDEVQHIRRSMERVHAGRRVSV